jgi:hypothetical protein
MRSKSADLFLVLGAMGAVACGQRITDSANRHSRVVLDVRSLFGAVLGGDFVSVLDTAHLTIASGGEQQTLTQVFGPGDSETTFDVTVKTGSATFSLDVISNNGTLLYQGETTSPIDGDGFVVTITPQAVNPVMVVYPAHMTFTLFDNGQILSLTDTLRLRNAGPTTLTWKMERPSQLDSLVTFSCSVPSLDASCLSDVQWTPGTDEDVIVQFFMPSKTVSTLPQSLKFLSTTVGSVSVATTP